MCRCSRVAGGLNVQLSISVDQGCASLNQAVQILDLMLVVLSKPRSATHLPPVCLPFGDHTLSEAQVHDMLALLALESKLALGSGPGS